MPNSILFCEGERDTCFLYETSRNVLNINSVKIYKNEQKINSDLRSRRYFKISIIEGGGYPICCVKKPLYFSRNFWSSKILLNIGVINDSDVGSAYDILKNNTNNYLKDKNRVTNLKPEANYVDKLKTIILNFPNREPIKIWNLLVPNSLEHQMCKILKTNYTELNNIKNEKALFIKTCELLDCEFPQLIIHCIELFKETYWYKQLLKKISSYLEIE